MRIIFAATAQFALPSLQKLINSQQHQVIAVYTQPDRPAGRGRKLTASPVKQLAEKFVISVMQPTTLCDAQVQRQLAALQPDLMIVVAYGLLLPKAVLAIPQFGCINVHGSLLPRWRGAAPIQRAILAGDKKTGISIIQMDAGLDTGDVLLTTEIPLRITDTFAMIHDQLAELGGELLLKTIAQLAAGKLVRHQQDDAQACYAAKITKAEARIDWQQSAEKIDRLIRAFNPWPVAFSTIDDQALRIWEAEIISITANKKPGTILQTDNNGIQIATNENIINIKRIQLPGKKALPVAELLHAHTELFAVGKCFG